MAKVFEIRVNPKSSRRKVVELDPGQLKIYVRAPAQKGLANAEVQRVLADFFGVPKSSIEILRGKEHRKKWVKIHD